MGAAAFIIAEYLRVSYIAVLTAAIVPTILYYIYRSAIRMRSSGKKGNPGPLIAIGAGNVRRTRK